MSSSRQRCEADRRRSSLRGSISGRMVRSFAAVLLLLSFSLLASPARAQLSFSSVIDMAQHGSPKVKMAQADVDRARAALAETHDVYIPSLVAGFGEGKSYGPPLGQPAVFSVMSQSLLFSFAQRSYIRAARAGFDAANLALQEARQAVIEDAAVTYLLLTTRSSAEPRCSRSKASQRSSCPSCRNVWMREGIRTWSCCRRGAPWPRSGCSN